MKNSIFNKKESGRRGNLLAALLMVTASLLYCSSAWAGTVALFSLNANYNNSDHNYNIYRSEGECTNPNNYPFNTNETQWLTDSNRDFGVVTSSKIKFYGYIWLAYQTEYKNGYFGHKLDSGSFSNTDFGKYGDYNDWCGNNWYRYDMQYELSLSSVSAGSHTFTFYARIPWSNNDWYANNGGNNYYYTFTVPGWATNTSTYNYEGTTKIGVDNQQTISLGTHYGSNTSIKSVFIDGTNKDDFAYVSDGSTIEAIKITFTPTAVGARTATVTITDNYSKTYTLTVNGTGVSNTTPTVLIAQNEHKEGNLVTLSGYVKFTGCSSISKVGFKVGTNEAITTDVQIIEADTHGTYGKGMAGTSFSLNERSFSNGTYYYKAYMTDGTSEWTSEETRSFQILTSCDVTTVDATIGDGTHQFTTYAVKHTGSDIVAHLKSATLADSYAWSCTKYPDGAKHAIAGAGLMNTTVTVDLEGEYWFALTASCTSPAAEKTSETIKLFVCKTAAQQTLTLDGYTANVVCKNEGALAEIISEAGYTYTLYRTESAVTTKIGSQVGSGKTISWRDIKSDTDGTFSVTAYTTGVEACESVFTGEAVVGTATQKVNNPTLKITSNESAMSYQPVTIAKVAASSTVDTKPTWIISGGTGGYLLNSSTGLAYEGEAVDNVILKAAKETEGEYSLETYTVQATATKTVAAVASTSPEKTCEATDSVNITVSPATDGCGSSVIHCSNQ